MSERNGRGREVRMPANGLLDEARPFQSQGQRCPTWNSTLGSEDTEQEEDLVRSQTQTPFVGTLLEKIHPNQARLNERDKTTQLRRQSRRDRKGRPRMIRKGMQRAAGDPDQAAATPVREERGDHEGVTTRRDETLPTR